jgi:jumonji domain-containing protein 2
MYRSFFAWHTEDVDLYSVNYLHFGAPKVWYTVPPKHRKRFESSMRSSVPELFMHCDQFLRHKELLASPMVLRSENIPLVKFVQRENEWVINYPGAYHAGFNCGFNCAESTNFATSKWISIGKEAKCCECSKDSVRLDMDLFERFDTKCQSIKQEEEGGDEEAKERDIANATTISSSDGSNRPLGTSDGPDLVAGSITSIA